MPAGFRLASIIEDFRSAKVVEWLEVWACGVRKLDRKGSNMTTSTKPWLRRITAAAGALALGVAALAGGALSAQASDPVAGNINPDTNQSFLTIHKYDGNEGTAGDGTELSDVSGLGNALDGVEFTVTKVATKTVDGVAKDIDLTTPAGWDLIDGVKVGDVTGSNSAYALSSVASDKYVETTANGSIAEFSGLPYGLYLIQETKAPANVASKTADFLVTLPLPKVAEDNATDGTWIYDVNVYPKNQVLDAPEKKINESKDQMGLKVGDTVEYTITQKVPALNQNADGTPGEYTLAQIYDVLGNDLAYASTSDKGVTLNGTPLTEGTDYTIDSTGVTWTLSEGMLKTIKADDVLSVTFTAKVLHVSSTGEIANPGSDMTGPGYGSKFNDATKPGEKIPYTYWGKLNVTKQDEGGNALAGADFTVTDTDANGSRPAAVGTAVSTGSSDSNGVVQWDSDPTSPLGLFVANSNAGQLTNPTRNYCLYETKAPAGFSIADEYKDGKLVTITSGDETQIKQVPVTNVQKNHPNLPLTGAAGMVVMTVAGVALIGAGAAAYVAARKRESIR